MSTDLQSARTIFLDALDHARPDDRKAFIDSACTGDESLQREVLRLLDAHADLDNFMDRPAAAVVNPTVEHCGDEQVGATIGRYKLLEQIGEGGMGVVYVAEQTEPVRRRVALKIIKPGMDTRQVIARFEAERQALAMMDHPNIARVHDGGATETGRPYFVMELVRGMPITDYCDQAKLDVRDRLDLFMTVCHAVQHAHQKGVIHRDLKPSNVLVTIHDGKPVAKVIDFGVAKATGRQLTEQTIYTAFTEMIGTPLYMSPEQAELSGLDIDTRSDVYSLGVLLYELLTGQTPFDRDTLVKAGLDEVRRMIREDEPPRPSHRISTLAAETGSTVSQKRGIDQRQLSRALHGELDWIVMKALEKDRNRRYESASAFADDLERFLLDKPVEACPPSAWYRFAKMVRRNRIAATAAAAIALAVAVGAGVSVWHAVRATRAEQRSDARYRIARQAVDDMYTQVAEKWLSDQKEMTHLQRGFLEKALALYTQFAGERADDYAARLDAVRARNRVANIEQSLGELDAAKVSCKNALSQVHQLLEIDPDWLEAREVLADTLSLLANTALKRNQFDEAESTQKRALLISEGLLKQHPNNSAYRAKIAAICHDLGRTYSESGRDDAAGPLFQRACEIYGQLRTESPKSIEFHAVSAEAERSYALHLRRAGRHSEGKQALERSRVLSAKVSDPANQMHALNREGIALWNAGKRLEAESLFRHIDATIQKWIDDELSTGYDSLLWNILGHRTVAIIDGLTLDDDDRALQLACEYLYRAAEMFPNNNAPRRLLIVAEYRRGNHDVALELAEKFYKLQSPEVPPDPQDAARAPHMLYFVLALVHAKRGDMETARAWYAKTASEVAMNLRIEAPNWLVDEATSRFGIQPLLPLMAESYAADPANTDLLGGVASYLAWFGSDTELDETCQRALAHYQDTDDPAMADRVCKACSLQPSSDPKRLAAVLQLARRTMKPGTESPYAAWFPLSLGMAEYRSGNYIQADRALTEATNSLRRLQSAHTASFYRAMALFKQGKETEARKVFADTAARMEPLPADQDNPRVNGRNADYVILWLAHKEARDLIAPREKPADQASQPLDSTNTASKAP